MAKSSGGTSAIRRILSHRGLIAIEALLLTNVLKDWVFDVLRRSSFPNYMKVLMVMAATLGIFGGLFFLVERLTARGFAHTHGMARRLPFTLPTFAIHGTLLFLLFLLYARMLRLAVL
jgi:hypothetical protein